MTFSLKIEGQDCSFQSIIYEKHWLTLVPKNVDTGQRLRIKCPFDFSAIDAADFQSADDGKVLLLRNKYWSAGQLFRLTRGADGNGKNYSVGYIVSIQLLIDDSVQPKWSENVHVQKFLARGIFQLLNGDAGITPKPVSATPDGVYRFDDFFDSDILLCIISLDQFGEFSKQKELELLYRLNLSGFYFICQQNKSLRPSPNEWHREALQSKFGSTVIASERIRPCIPALSEDPYFEHYIKSMALSEAGDWMTQFMQLYQFYEILKDYVLIAEVKSKIVPKIEEGKLTGYDLKAQVLEIGSDGSLVRRLLSEYVHGALSTSVLMERLRPWCESSQEAAGQVERKPSVGDLIYRLRNLLVHNLRGVYTNDHRSVEIKLKDLVEIIHLFEYQVVELTLCIVLPPSHEPTVPAAS